MKQLVQIVPRLPPAVDGVGDYGLALATEMRRRFGTETAFICGAPEWTGPAEVEGFPVRAAAGELGAVLPEFLAEYAPNGATVLLNYVGPGYERNGCPYGLRAGMRRWRRQRRPVQWITMFHELYSEGPPWTRSFWTNPFQRHVAGSIARQSDVVRTNAEIMRERLGRMLPAGTPVNCVPVFSNVGETRQSLAPDQRAPWLAVFGSVGWRTNAFGNFRSCLDAVCAQLGVEQILDLGAPLGFTPRAAVPVKSLGRLAAEEVAHWLRTCQFGFSTYPSRWLGKSGILAAYCAHGCIPVAPAECRQPGPELDAIPVLYADDLLRRPELAMFQQRVREWYEPHSLPRQAEGYQAMLDAFAA